MASISCIKHTRELRALYLKRISQRKKPKQAFVCVGKKPACIMYSMLKNGISYTIPKGSLPKLDKEQNLGFESYRTRDL